MRRFGSLLGVSGLCASLLLHPLPASASPGKPVPVYRGTPACSYTVQPGDTIFALAKRLGLSVDALYSFNGLHSDYLETGQVLLLPGGSYTVQPGDTIFALARRFGVSVDTLYSFNGLHSDYLETGQVLRLPGRPNGTCCAFDPAPGEVSRGLGPLDRVVAYALRFQGVPWAYGGSTPRAFDCSGFVRYVYAAFGINLPHSSCGQWRIGRAVASNQLRPGDLVFFNTDGLTSHVGIYVGNGRFISATCSEGVAVEPVYSGYWSARYAGARRL